MTIAIPAPARPRGPAPERRRDAAAALAKARDHLLSLQSPEGWWRGELETNVTMDAEDMLLREMLGIRDPAETDETAAWIRSQQGSDGTWATFYGGPPDLSATVEAYVALRLAGDDPGDEHMRAAAEHVRRAGGLRATRTFTRIWLAMFGLWPWDQLPAIPPEMIFLPPWVPLNIYDFACWARQTVVALSVVSAYRPVHSLDFGLDELEGAPRPAPRAALSPVERRLGHLDSVLRAYGRRPLRKLRSIALDAAESWIVSRQEADGSWGGIQPPWVYSLIALYLRGYAMDHPVMRAGLEGLERFTIRDERGRRLEACQSPVWDTALAVTALVDAGLPPDHPALCRARDWLVSEEVRRRGDWAVRRPWIPAGGWAFEHENDVYPDVDDTAEVVIALRRVAPTPESDAAARRGIAWAEGMQSSDGGWGAFDADNTRALVAALPVCDFGEVIDPPSADVTAHMVEMLAAEPSRDPVRFARGIRWLWDAQEEDGSWFGRWGVNHIYGTGAAVPALIAAGAPASDPRIRSAVDWLLSCQAAGGGWGEDLRSYRDARWRGRGEPTASQTAWALLALLAAGRRDGPTERGVAWLVETQRDDGTWDEPWYTGTGFPWDFSINYHLYRLVFPVMALGRFVHGTGPGAGR